MQWRDGGRGGSGYKGVQGRKEGVLEVDVLYFA